MSTRDASTQAEDDLGFAAALKLAIPAGLALWAALIMALFRFVI